MVERIRDSAVAEEIAAQAGTDATPDLVLGEVLTPVIFAPQRPPLASSGYFPGTIGVDVAASALNFSNVGIFGSGFGGAIVRVNWLRAYEETGSAAVFTLRRVNAPFVGFPSVRAVPGYINAGNDQTGRVFSITKNDSPAVSGAAMCTFQINASESLQIDGPWIINDGILLVSTGAINRGVRVLFGYEVWNALRVQPPG